VSRRGRRMTTRTCWTESKGRQRQCLHVSRCALTTQAVTALTGTLPTSAATCTARGQDVETTARRVELRTMTSPDAVSYTPSQALRLKIVVSGNPTDPSFTGPPTLKILWLFYWGQNFSGSVSSCFLIMRHVRIIFPLK